MDAQPRRSEEATKLSGTSLHSSFHKLILSVPGLQRVQRFHQAEVGGYQRNRGQANFRREVRVRE